MRTSRINVQKTIREKRTETKNVKWKNILNLKQTLPIIQGRPTNNKKTKYFLKTQNQRINNKVHSTPKLKLNQNSISQQNKKEVIVIHVQKGVNREEYEKLFKIFQNTNQEFKKSLDSFKKIYTDTLDQYKASLILIKHIGEMTITKELIDNFEELKNSLENYKNLANDIKRQSDEDITSKLIEKRPSNISELKSLTEQVKNIKKFLMKK